MTERPYGAGTSDWGPPPPGWFEPPSATADPPPPQGRPVPGPPPAPRRSAAPAVDWATPDRRAAVVVVLIAIAFDAAAHGRADGLGTSVLVAVVAVGLLGSGRVTSRPAMVVTIAAIPFGMALAARSSIWLLPFDLVTALALLMLGVSYASGGRLLKLSATGLGVRIGRALLSMFGAPAFALGAAMAWVPARTADRRARLVAVGRGIGVAIPVVVVLGVLLASADDVFASAFHLPFGLGDIAANIALIGVGVMLAAWLLVDASAEPLGAIELPARVLGPTEAGIVLGAVGLLYAGFVGAQVVAARGGAAHVIDTAGLTYASYARQGFFQLLAVAALTLALLLGLRAATGETTRRARVALIVLGEAVVVLTLVIVAVAIIRLGLYEQAFGLTMLRLLCAAVAWWLGGVFLLVGLAYAGVARRRRWIFATIVASAAVLVLVLNMIDPEAIVVRRNVERAAVTGKFDTDYLTELSDDAVPALADSLPSLAEQDRALVVRRICVSPRQSQRPGDIDRSGLGFNLAAQRAADVRALVCNR